MVTECPVCKDGKKYMNKGLKTHIGKMANRGDKAHKKYRDSHKPDESQSESLIIDPLDQLEAELQKNWGKPVYKETVSQIPESVSKPPARMRKLANPEPPKKIQVRKLKTTVIKPKKIGLLAFKVLRRKPKVALVKPQKTKDPEGALGILTMIPAAVIVLALMYEMMVAIFTWNFSFFIGWTNSDMAQLYFWVISNPSEPISILILTLTGVMVTLTLFLVHKLLWRMCFKDLQVRYLKKNGATGELKAVGTSRIGRMYLTIGTGFWDRIYRRLAKKPVPDVVTIYFKRRGLVNPFKVLVSCDKGYLKDPDHSLFVNDGLFKRTLIATHLRRDTENHSTVYWFEGGDYEAIEFDSTWYEDTHRWEIKTGLSMVAKACGMDSSIQKDQMRNSMSFEPPELIAEQKRIWELKKAKMPKVQPELSR